MSIKRKYWVTILILLIPYLLYGITFFDSLIGYLMGGHIELFSYPFILLLEPLNYLLGKPEGLGFALIIANLVYPVYSLAVLILAVFFTWKYYKSTRKLSVSYLTATILIVIFPLCVFYVGNSLSYARYKKEDQQLLEKHNNLTVSPLPAEVKENEIVVPLIIHGLKPENQLYALEAILREKNSNYGALGNVLFNANYVGGAWKYRSIFYPSVDDVKQDNDIVYLHFQIDSSSYDRDQLEILVDISLEANNFYSDQFNLETK